MDEIQKVLVKVGRKDLAQGYYEKMTKSANLKQNTEKVRKTLQELWSHPGAQLEKARDAEDVLKALNWHSDILTELTYDYFDQASSSFNRDVQKAADSFVSRASKVDKDVVKKILKQESDADVWRSYPMDLQYVLKKRKIKMLKSSPEFKELAKIYGDFRRTVLDLRDKYEDAAGKKTNDLIKKLWSEFKKSKSAAKKHDLSKVKPNILEQAKKLVPKLLKDVKLGKTVKVETFGPQIVAAWILENEGKIKMKPGPKSGPAPLDTRPTLVKASNDDVTKVRSLMPPKVQKFYDKKRKTVLAELKRAGLNPSAKANIKSLAQILTAGGLATSPNWDTLVGEIGEQAAKDELKITLADMKKAIAKLQKAKLPLTNENISILAM